MPMQKKPTLNDGVKRKTTVHQETAFKWIQQGLECSAIVLLHRTWWKRVRIYQVRVQSRQLMVMTEGGYWYSTESVEAVDV